MKQYTRPNRVTFDINLSNDKTHLGYYKHLSIFTHNWDTYHLIKNILIFDLRRRKTKLLSTIWFHMDLENGIFNLSGYFKLFHWSHFVEYFNQLMVMVYGGKINVPKYSNNIVTQLPTHGAIYLGKPIHFIFM